MWWSLSARQWRLVQTSTYPTDRGQWGAGLGHKRETSSATISAACSQLAAQRNALTGPLRKRFDVTGRPHHRRRRLVADDCFAEAKCAITSPSPGRRSRGAARGFPHLGRRVAQSPVGRVRPPDVVEVGVPLRIGLNRVDQATAVLARGWASPGRAETGSPPTPPERPARARRPRRERPRSRRRRSPAPATPHPRRRAQGKRRDLTDVTPSLPTLATMHRRRCPPLAGPLRRSTYTERLRWRHGPVRRSQWDPQKRTTRSAVRPRGPVETTC